MRRALEFDVAGLDAVELGIPIAGRISHQLRIDWTEYAAALRGQPWPHFSCRSAQITIDDDGASIGCQLVGVVFAVAMPEADLVALTPHGAFRGMPLAMAMIVARRALFGGPRLDGELPRVIRVVFDERPEVVLNDIGDWLVA